MKRVAIKPIPRRCIEPAAAPDRSAANRGTVGPARALSVRAGLCAAALLLAAAASPRPAQPDARPDSDDEVCEAAPWDVPIEISSRQEQTGRQDQSGGPTLAANPARHFRSREVGTQDAPAGTATPPADP